MDVVTLPSHREGMPRLPMEAGLMQKPVVATNIRGCREVIQDGRTGILVPVGDVAAFADAIVRLLQDPALASQMGLEARAYIQAHFDERAVFARILAGYRELCSRKGLCN